jgi:hypothetical protein
MDSYTNATQITYVAAENVAYNARKIVEATAFACLIALDHGLKSVPRDAKGKWNAEDIIRNIQAKGLKVWPNPSDCRQATAQETSETGATAVLDGQPHRRLDHSQLIAIYKRLHRWAHEINPYLNTTHDDFLKNNYQSLISDVKALAGFISNHTIIIQGKGFYCVLKDRADGLTKVIAFERPTA